MPVYEALQSPNVPIESNRESNRPCRRTPSTLGPMRPIETSSRLHAARVSLSETTWGEREPSEPPHQPRRRRNDPHPNCVCRRTAATTWLRSGVPLEETARLGYVASTPSASTCVGALPDDRRYKDRELPQRPAVGPGVMSAPTSLDCEVGSKGFGCTVAIRHDDSERMAASSELLSRVDEIRRSG